VPADEAKRVGTARLGEEEAALRGCVRSAAVPQTTLMASPGALQCTSVCLALRSPEMDVRVLGVSHS